jgi:hypothetical protein
MRKFKQRFFGRKKLLSPCIGTIEAVLGQGRARPFHSLSFFALRLSLRQIFLSDRTFFFPVGTYGMNGYIEMKGYETGGEGDGTDRG